MIQMTEKICATCGIEFSVPSAQIRKGHEHNFCSRKCVRRSEETKVRMSNSAKNSESHRSKNQFGEANSRYKGGYHDKHGYMLITVNGKATPMHRHIMSLHIGRNLYAHETVHHKNGVRDDNRIENLELWSTRNPKGQRVEDKLKFAKELLEDYGIGRIFSHLDIAHGFSLG